MVVFFVAIIFAKLYKLVSIIEKTQIVYLYLQDLILIIIIIFLKLLVCTINIDKYSSMIFYTSVPKMLINLTTILI